jgi:peroxiredoxin (alkyl hydroperoxide reductase subunit C)
MISVCHFGQPVQNDPFINVKTHTRRKMIMSLIGTEVKPFKASAYHNGQFIEVTEENLKGKWSVVCFYPADFTFVCPTELEDLQNQYATLKEMGAEVYSVSTDTHFTHKAWHDHSEAIGKIEYVMIGDPSQKISRNFDVLNEEEGLADRGTFIIDPDGIIQTVEINAGGIGRDASAVVSKLKAAQYVRNNPGEVCPAKWQEGAQTLKPSLDLVGKI